MTVLFGTSGNNSLTGTGAEDTLIGLGGNDLLTGGAGIDFLSGGAGKDTLVGGGNGDTLAGGLGDDLYDGVSLACAVVEGATGGFDTIRSAALRSLATLLYVEGLVWTGASPAALTGNAAGNLLRSLSAGADTLNGGEGNDTLDGGAGADRLIGGTGDDRFLWTTGDVIVEAAAGGFDTVEGLVQSYTGFTNVEALIHTGTAGVAITGRSVADWLRGGAGNDTVSGGSGADRLIGGAGTDRVIGGGGNDTLSGGATLAGADFRLDLGDGAADRLEGGAGNDTYHVFDATDRVVETETGGARDVVHVHGPQWSALNAPFVEGIVIAAVGGYARGSEGADTMLGGRGNDLLDGGAGNDTIAGFWIAGQAPLGGDGDTLAGGAGNDVLLALGGVTMPSGAAVALFGGSGDDLYVLSDTSDYVGWDASGTDQVVLVGPFSLSRADLSGLSGVEVINMTGGTGPATEVNPVVFAAASAAVVGVAGLAGQTIGSFPIDRAPQDLLANEEATLIYGNVFENEITALGGNDTVIGAGGADTIYGGAGDDLLVATFEDVNIASNEAENVIHGGAGNDRLVAGMFYEPGLGPFAVRGDILTGGTGADHFEIRTAVARNAASELGVTGSGVFGWRTAARITDFQTGIDDFVFEAGLVGNGNTTLDGAVVVTGPGGFAPSAELVILRSDIAPGGVADLRGQDAAGFLSVIGSATGALALGQTALMVVDNGTSSAVFLFQSADGNAAVTADELYMLAVVENTTALTAADFALASFT